MLGNIHKFSFGEMTSSNSGKTSSTTTAGLYIVGIGGLCFLLGVIDKMFIDKSIDIISQSIAFTGIGATLLGVKNVMAARNDKAASELLNAHAGDGESQSDIIACSCKNKKTDADVLNS
jgi:hypothetical protein